MRVTSGLFIVWSSAAGVDHPDIGSSFSLQNQLGSMRAWSYRLIMGMPGHDWPAPWTSKGPHIPGEFSGIVTCGDVALGPNEILFRVRVGSICVMHHLRMLVEESCHDRRLAFRRNPNGCHADRLEGTSRRRTSYGGPFQKFGTSSYLHLPYMTS